MTRHFRRRQRSVSVSAPAGPKPPDSSESPKQTEAVTISGLAHGGAAVGKLADGRVVFVPFAAPGDVALVEIARLHKRHAEGRLVALLQPSPARTSPRCPLFGTCGGCQWQHLPLEVQRRAKAEHVARALGLADVPVVAASEAYGYRWRARVCCQDGKVGFRTWRGHDIVDVAECPLLEPALSEALVHLKARLQGVATQTEVSLQRSRQGVATSPAMGRVPSASQAELDAAPAIDISSREEPPFWLRPGLFAQPSEQGNAILRKLVAEAVAMCGLCRPTILELFAGAGNFTRDLVASASHVTAVESHPDAASLLGRNVPSSVEVVGDRAETYFARAMAAGTSFDVLVLDPPRSGAKEIFDQLAELPAPRKVPWILYVSCDPMTLGRDVKSLASQGYGIVSAWAVDLMPQTFHVESVVLLRREAVAPGPAPI